MKIMLGVIAGAVSGALGNTVFSHNRHGYYARMRVIPTKVVNAYTTAARNILATVSAQWGALTAAQQQAWNTWAQSNPITDRLGQKQVLFGNAAYASVNARLLHAADTVIALPPTDPPPDALLTLSCVAGVAAGTAILTFTATPLAANERLWVQLAVVDNPGVNYFQNLMKLVVVSAQAQATGLDIVAEWIARFGSLIEGQKYYLQIQVIDSDTGLLSGPIAYTGSVAA